MPDELQGGEQTQLACTMPDELLNGKKTHLGLAIAQGTSIAAWARCNGVPKSTACRWAGEPEVRRAVDAWRRGNLDRAIGRMTKRATWAVDQIFDLGANSESDSVKLRAVRAVLSDMIKVSEFSQLEARITKIEERLDARDTNTDQPR